MRITQGNVHIPLTAGRQDGITMSARESGCCSLCGICGGDMVTFSHVPDRCGCLSPAPVTDIHVHVSCMESLTYTYRTGRKPRAQRKEK